MAQLVLIAQEAVGAKCPYAGLEADGVDVAAVFGDGGSELAFVEMGKDAEECCEDYSHGTALSLMSLVCCVSKRSITGMCCNRMPPRRTASSSRVRDGSDSFHWTSKVV